MLKKHCINLTLLKICAFSLLHFKPLDWYRGIALSIFKYISISDFVSRVDRLKNETHDQVK